MAASQAPETLIVTIGSRELGLPVGTLADLDRVVAHIPREELALRCVFVLTALEADRKHLWLNLSRSLAVELGPDHPVSRALKAADAIFLEPLQQLLILKRALTVAGSGRCGLSTSEGLAAYIDACRYASDVLSPAKVKAQTENSFLGVAANLLLRMSFSNPPHVTDWIARLRLMLTELPKIDSRAIPWANKLKERFEPTIGLNFDEVAQLTAILSLWSERFAGWDQVLADDAHVALDPESFLSSTRMDPTRLGSFFQRSALSTASILSDAEMGGPVSILPFRDRPFLKFANGNVAPISPTLVVEKLTYDMFWWAGSPDKKQAEPWQRDWGDLVELYVVRLLQWIADNTGCGFAADLRWDSKQIDAAMWFKGHVAVFEISAAMLRDTEGQGGDPVLLEKGLMRTLVRSSTPEGKTKREALTQVARDAKALLLGELTEQIKVDTINRVYPVVIAIDRRVGVPPLRFWFDEMFAREVEDCSERTKIAGLAVLTLEDLEAIEAIVRQNSPGLKGTPRGLLRLLRNWDILRDKLPGTSRRAGAWSHFINHQFSGRVANQRLKDESARWWQETRAIFEQPAP